jgi:hypothetical protein
MAYLPEFQQPQRDNGSTWLIFPETTAAWWAVMPFSHIYVMQPYGRKMNIYRCIEN